MKKKKQISEVVVDNDTWIDRISASQVSFGGRNGHVDCMREWAVKEFGSQAVALMSDGAIEKEILKADYLPIRVNGEHGLEDDGVFLIKKELLKALPCFSR